MFIEKHATTQHSTLARVAHFLTIIFKHANPRIKLIEFHKVYEIEFDEYYLL